MDYKIIYKLKKKNGKFVILTSEYMGFQDYIEENKRLIDLHIAKKNDDILFYTNKGLIVFDLHLRLSITEFEIINFISMKTDYPLILIGHPVMNQYNILNELRHNFEIITLESPDL